MTTKLLAANPDKKSLLASGWRHAPAVKSGNPFFYRVTANARHWIVRNWLGQWVRQCEWIHGPRIGAKL